MSPWNHALLMPQPIGARMNAISSGNWPHFLRKLVEQKCSKIIWTLLNPRFKKSQQWKNVNFHVSLPLINWWGQTTYICLNLYALTGILNLCGIFACTLPVLFPLQDSPAYFVELNSYMQSYMYIFMGSLLLVRLVVHTQVLEVDDGPKIRILGKTSFSCLI